MEQEYDDFTSVINFLEKQKRKYQNISTSIVKEKQDITAQLLSLKAILEQEKEKGREITEQMNTVGALAKKAPTNIKVKHKRALSDMVLLNFKRDKFGVKKHNRKKSYQETDVNKELIQSKSMKNSMKKINLAKYLKKASADTKSSNSYNNNLLNRWERLREGEMTMRKVKFGARKLMHFPIAKRLREEEKSRISCTFL